MTAVENTLLVHPSKEDSILKVTLDSLEFFTRESDTNILFVCMEIPSYIYCRLMGARRIPSTNIHFLDVVSDRECSENINRSVEYIFGYPKLQVVLDRILLSIRGESRRDNSGLIMIDSLDNMTSLFGQKPVLIGMQEVVNCLVQNPGRSLVVHFHPDHNPGLYRELVDILKGWRHLTVDPSLVSSDEFVMLQAVPGGSVEGSE